jgi:hypothetical protein
LSIVKQYNNNADKQQNNSISLACKTEGKQKENRRRKAG